MNRKKIKILRIISSLDPKFGGPTRGIIETSKQLIDSGLETEILTLDKKKFNYSKIKIHNISSYIFNKYKFSLKLIKWLNKNKNKYDFFIIHGLWQFQTLVARILLKKKYVVFAHGQLDPFFKLNFIKRIKKQLYWKLIEKKNLLNSRSLLITSIGEKNSLKNTYVDTSNIKKVIVKYGIYKEKINEKKVLKKFYNKFPELKKNNFYLFLGRYHEKKGCEIIINSINSLKKNFNSKILLAGPINKTKYEQKLLELIKKNKLQKIILFSNALYGDEKWGAIKASKAMLLPSHGENFGISLVEALSLKKPVITTDKVNISKIIKKFNAGLISKNNLNSFKLRLLEFENYKQRKLSLMSSNALTCFKKNFDLSNKSKSFSKTIKEMIKNNE